MISTAGAGLNKPTYIINIIFEGKDPLNTFTFSELIHIFSMF